MKGVIFLFAVLLLSGFAIADIPTDCDDSMVSYWKLDGDATDSFGNNNGVSSGVDYIAVGVNNVGEFVAVDTITFPYNYLSGENFTIEMILKSKEPATIFNKNNYLIEWISVRGDDPFIKATVNNVELVSSSLIKNTLYHVALTGSSGNIYLYIDSVLEDNKPASLPSSSGSIIIGEGLTGTIDEVAIYNSTLSASTIQSHYAKANAGNDYCSLSGSNSNASFNVAGCSEPGYNVPAEYCSSDGSYFCNKTSGVYSLKDVLKIPNACSLGILTELGIEDEKCCPSGYACKWNETYYMCERRTESCSEFITVEECEEESCYWFGDIGSGSCIEDPTEYGCNVYNTNTSCSADVFRLGINGLEAKKQCGTYFQITDGSYWLYDGCSCGWSEASERCKLDYEVTCFIGEDCGSFKCSKDFNIGDCIDGNQLVSWDVNVTNRQGPFDNASGDMTGEEELLFDEVVNASCFKNVGIERSCGSEVVKFIVALWVAQPSRL
jgi:hypothetical protein